MKETSRSLLFSFQETKCAQTLCDASDCFHTLLRLQRMIRKKKQKKNGILQQNTILQRFGVYITF